MFWNVSKFFSIRTEQKNIFVENVFASLIFACLLVCIVQPREWSLPQSKKRPPSEIVLYNIYAPIAGTVIPQFSNSFKFQLNLECIYLTTFPNRAFQEISNKYISKVDFLNFLILMDLPFFGVSFFQRQRTLWSSELNDISYLSY